MEQVPINTAAESIASVGGDHYDHYVSVSAEAIRDELGPGATVDYSYSEDIQHAALVGLEALVEIHGHDLTSWPERSRVAAQELAGLGWRHRV